ncbi:hypothetical protein JX265_005526 [Neoarthrinium moseri]|uniref:Uncharacterized protein n=1 Tax=Neoarthrinium moseri TaxID=1658444 RepID=A0A9Q0AQ81_9PEZI|nr:hypothetical protein JX265_005526 [Neoarthrinium moseri]
MRNSLVLCAVTALAAQLTGGAPTPTSTPSKLSDYFWQLRDLDRPASKANPYIGGQNRTICCLKAIAESLRIDGDFFTNTTDFISASPSELYQKALENQFPCDAVYNGDPTGAPEVNVPYAWWASECPGWQLNDHDNLNSWLQPMSGFLIPAIPLIFSIPRRRKLEVYREFFTADLSGIKSYLAAPLGALGAALIVTLDTLIWLATCFAFAAPMILSGLYEAVLDNRMLDYLKEKMQNKRLTLDMRARCLMVILIGNLDLGLEGDERPVNQLLEQAGTSNAVIEGRPLIPLDDRIEFHGETAADTADHEKVPSPAQVPTIGIEEPSQPDDYSPLTRRGNERPRRTSTARTLSPNTETSLARPPSSTDVPVSRNSQSSGLSRSRGASLHRRPTVQQAASPWRHMENLLYEIRLYDDEEAGEFPRQWPKHDCNNRLCEDHAHIEQPRRRDHIFDSFVAKTKTRLRTMLHCQSSFGTIVGAPVIFFLGGFIFALLSSRDMIGDEDIAEALAFGQWYMIIPHISIISGLLLAGNNPNILEGVFATERGEEKDIINFFGLRFGLAFPSCYKTAWQWRRGHGKKTWISKVIDTYGVRKDVDFKGNIEPDDDMEDLREKTTLVAFDWIFILAITTLLIYVPYVLAFLTSYFTPPIGLACRSLTSSVYASSQAGQILLWFWANCGPPMGKAKNETQRGTWDFARQGGWLDRNGFFNPSSVSWLIQSNPDWSVDRPWRILKSRRFWSVRMLFSLIYQFLVVIFGISAVFSVLGGTLMQLMGVYSANMCYVPSRWWLVPFEDRPVIMISKNTALMITMAQRYWEPCAITAIVFLAVVSFIGWWYQRRMRDLFGELVRSINAQKYDREDTRSARPLKDRRPADLGGVSVGS